MNQHLVFNVAYPGISRTLVAPAELVDPLTGKTVSVSAVWDTGATASVINTSVAQSLGLTPTGQTTVHTANGKAIVNTFVVNLVLPNNPKIVINLNVSEGNLGPAQMLVGMDVISLGDFTVQNYNGKTHFSFCLPPFEHKYDMIEKANTVNHRVAKAIAKRLARP